MPQSVSDSQQCLSCSSIPGSHVTTGPFQNGMTHTWLGSQAPRFNAAVVAWPLSCCGITTSVSFAMHLFNPLGVRSYRESRAVL